MSQARILSRDLDELLGSIPADNKPMQPAKAVGKYVSTKLAEGDVDAAALGLEQILTAYSAPLPPATVSQLGLMRDQVFDLRRPKAKAPQPTAPLALVPVRRPVEEEEPPLRTLEDLDRYMLGDEPRRAARPGREAGSIGRAPPPMRSTFAPAPPPASTLFGQPQPQPLMPAVRPPGPPAPQPSQAGADTGKWLLLGALGLGLGIARWSDGR